MDPPSVSSEDQTAIQGEHVTLPCPVANKRGMLQWTKDGFGLGIERNLTGFDRYHMTGSDEEGEEGGKKVSVSGQNWPSEGQ